MVGTLVLAQFLTILYGKMARLGAVFNFNFTILNAKAASGRSKAL